MSAKQTKNGFEFECDACGETFTLPRLGLGSSQRDFAESLASAKEAGFRAVNVDGEWQHRCASCPR